MDDAAAGARHAASRRRPCAAMPTEGMTGRHSGQISRCTSFS
ncbi:hypothetical protein SXCC_01801 [Gluconacetobacter sp. SXCC-1]|nr:hypothetical protein SXCC_01801 [Gluconacetobacter sp. SXCC-1]